MQTKILIIVGVSVAAVLALFVMGYLLNKDETQKENVDSDNERTPDPPPQQDAN